MLAHTLYNPASTNVDSTSPSIYANFHDVTLNLGDVEDPCSIPISMLTFAPGDLSTIVGPPTFTRPADEMYYAVTKPYNFGDLPCPPHQVMVRFSVQSVKNSCLRLNSCRRRIGIHPSLEYHINLSLRCLNRLLIFIL